MQELSLGSLTLDFGETVNDIHSRLNKTWVCRLEKVASVAQIQAVVKQAGQQKIPVAVAGARHAMGGQQFRAGGILIDMTEFNRVVAFDQTAGLITVEAGIQWPALVAFLARTQGEQQQKWAIIQKQTGADRLSVGGALSANAHGRGLCLKPIIDNVASIVLVDPSGRLRFCNRQVNYQLFRLAIGGYGLFGVIAIVTLRLAPRKKLMRQVSLLPIEKVIDHLEQSALDGCLYGDFQFSIDENSDDFLKLGIASTYQVVYDQSPVPHLQKHLSDADWESLVQLAHTDRERAFRQYCDHYLSTNGQLYWSDRLA